MDPIETFRVTAQELVVLAQTQGIDLEPFRNDFVFQKDRRWIDVWRKDSFPGSGPASEPLGTLHYAMQGAIIRLPERLKGSASVFQGCWHETGTFSDLPQALEFLKAWLLERKEVDDLPQRSVRSYGIG